jgi:hypothetical protein
MIRFFAILFCLMIGAQAQEKKTPATPASPQHNFLFIIDSSISMASRKTAAVQMVRDLIASGFEGQIRAGDSIDIWLYDQENHISNFPPQIWEDADAKRIAGTAARFIELQKFKGRSQFGPVARDLDALLSNAKRLLIVIVTDGDEPLSGMSLDIDINEFLAREKRSKPNAKQPFLISIAAVNGKFKEWSAYCDKKDEVLASLPNRPKPAVVAEVKPKEKPPEPEKKQEPEKPVVLDLPPGAKLSAVAAPKVEAPVIQPTPPPVKQEPEPTNQVAVVVPPVKAPEVENSKSNSPALAAKTTVEPPAPPANPKTAQEPVQPTQVAPIDLAADPNVHLAEVKIEPKAATPVITEPVKVSPPIPPLGQAISAAVLYVALAVAGLAIMALGGLLFLRKAKARQAGSIISRSLQL